MISPARVRVSEALRRRPRSPNTKTRIAPHATELGPPPDAQLGEGDGEADGEGDADGEAEDEGEGDADGVACDEGFDCGSSGAGPPGSGGAGGAASEMTKRTARTERPAAMDIAIVLAPMGGLAPVLCADDL